MIMVVPDAGKRCLTALGAGASLGGEGWLVVVACPFSPTILGPFREQAPNFTVLSNRELQSRCGNTPQTDLGNWLRLGTP